MVERDQVKPLAPASDGHHDDELVVKKTTRRRKGLRWCGCIAAVLLLLAVVVVILIFTVFKVKDPEIKMNGVQLGRLDLINGTIPRPGSNMSLIADISVKNPNFASFRYKNTTTSLYYHKSVIGEARGPSGKSKARRTMRMNITIDIMVDSLLGNTNLQNDIGTGSLTMSSYTRVGGRVKWLGFIKRHVIVKMNCTMTINITSRAIQDQKCKRKVKL